jgi:hypothetical protein
MLASSATSDAHVCSVNDGYHCYSITRWEMTKPEELKGAYVQIEAYYGLVPNWTNEFLDDEMWVAFPAAKASAWVEGGVTVGYGTGETKPAYFLAESYGPHIETEYFEQIYPEGPPYNAWSGLYWDQPGAGGTWCATWSWDHSPDYCFTGFPHSSTDVESGLEFAATAASGADNNGRNFSWAQYMDNSWHHEWNDGVTRAQPEREKPLCIVAPAPGYTWGSIAYSVPGC